MSPFIVTTKRNLGPDLLAHGDTFSVSRRAVATLDKARNQAYEAVLNALPRACGYPVERAAALDAIDALPESGGTVGPLPDGTLICVERQADDFDVAAFNARMSQV